MSEIVADVFIPFQFIIPLCFIILSMKLWRWKVHFFNYQIMYALNEIKGVMNQFCREGWLRATNWNWNLLIKKFARFQEAWKCLLKKVKEMQLLISVAQWKEFMSTNHFVQNFLPLRKRNGKGHDCVWKCKVVLNFIFNKSVPLIKSNGILFMVHRWGT